MVALALGACSSSGGGEVVAPKVTQISPAKIAVETPTLITITGTNLPDNLRADLKDASCEAGKLLSPSEYQIRCQYDRIGSLPLTVSFEEPGAHKITLATQNITFFKPPKIASINPHTAIANVEQEFVLSGTDLMDGLSVRFDNASCKTPQRQNANVYTVQCTATQAGKAQLAVQHEQVLLKSQEITVAASPSKITSITPNNAQINQAQTYTIAGELTQTPTLTLANGSCDPVSKKGEHYQATCTINRAGTETLTAKSANAVFNAYITVSAPPSVTKARANTVVYANSRTEFTITGDNLSVDNIQVTLGGETCQGALENAQTYLAYCTAPAAPGDVPLEVQHQGKALNNTSITVRNRASVTDITPAQLFQNTATTLTISGSDFEDGDLTVTLAGKNCPSSYQSASQYTTECTADTIGSAMLQVRDATGTLWQQALNVVAKPVVNAATGIQAPSHIYQNVPAEFIITGSHLTDALSVTLGNDVCSVSRISDTEYKASCIATEMGAQTLSVNTGAQTISAATTPNVVATPTPKITAHGDINATVGIGKTLTFTGTGLIKEITASLAQGSCEAGSVNADGTVYSVRCTANHLSGNTLKLEWNAQELTTVDLKLSMPVPQLAALRVGDALQFTWNHLGASSYRLYYARAPLTSGNIGSANYFEITSGTSTSITAASTDASNKKLQINGIYYFALLGVDGSNTSPLSNNQAGGLGYVNPTNQGTDKMTFVKVANQTGCVIDTRTGLMWELKENNSNSLHHKGLQLPWYNTDNKTNGGKEGTKNGGNCSHFPALTAQFKGECNTEKFVELVNGEKLCEFNDWRMPTYKELHSLVDFSKHGFMTIDSHFFPNTISKVYWSSSPFAGDKNNAWGVSFSGGDAGNYTKNGQGYVRLVRAGQ